MKHRENYTEDMREFMDWKDNQPESLRIIDDIKLGEDGAATWTITVNLRSDEDRSRDEWRDAEYDMGFY